MKKALLLLLALIFSEIAQAQSWGAPGAEWHFRVDHPYPPYQDGYMKVTITSTSTLNNITYYNLEGTFYGQVNSVNFPTVTLNYFSAKTYEDNDVLYVYNITTSSYDTIANFNANIGDKWRMTQKSDLNNMPCNSNIPRVVLTVIDTDHVAINSINLKRIKLLTSTSLTLTLLEKVGGIDGFLYPYFVCSVDAYNTGVFVCYSDNSFPLYQNPGYNLPCNFTTVGKEEFTLEGLEASVYPNPVADVVKIEISGQMPMENYRIFIHDALGREVLSQDYELGSDLNVSTLEQGLYHLSIYSEGQLLVKRKLIKTIQ